MSATQQQETSSGTKTPAKKTTTSTTKGKTTTTTTTSKPRKAEAVLTDKEMGRMVDLGLGRGVDATHPTPWLNKSAFQVRNCTLENIIGTEEGGALQSYEREVSSVSSQQSSLKASVTVPQSPVSIGMDAEQSRSYSTTRKVVGKKVLNRTISFRADFEDLPQAQDAGDAKLASVEMLTGDLYKTEQETEKSAGDVQQSYTFEERLSKWVIERILQRESIMELKLADEGKPIPKKKFQPGGRNPVDDLAQFLHTSLVDERREIVSDCEDFVRYFRITHYVSAIELGAAQYRVFSENEYYTRVRATGTLGIEALANFVISETFSKKTKKTSSDLRQIGVIGSDGRVERGSYDEAVVGIQIQPISHLLRLRYLQLAMRKALLKYIGQQGDTSAGPYLVSCCDEKIFWCVDKDNNYAVVATRRIENASEFYVIPSDDGEHPYEFLIGYRGDETTQHERSSITVSAVANIQMGSIARYLNTPVNFLGSNPGPLHLQYEVAERKSRLTLQSRLVKEYSPVDTRTWTSGGDLFFINCSRRKFKRDGYICVKCTRQQRLITASVPSVKSNFEPNTWMLFRLLPASYRDDKLSRHEARDEVDDSEDEEYKIAFGSDTPEEVHRSHLAPPKPGKSGASGRSHIDTSGGSIPQPGREVEIPELRASPTTDPTRVKSATTTAL